jgi:hypothetical protein
MEILLQDFQHNHGQLTQQVWGESVNLYQHKIEMYLVINTDNR